MPARIGEPPIYTAVARKTTHQQEIIIAPEVGILVIHGIGIQKKNFADGLKDKVNGRLEKIGVSRETVAWEPAFWADLLTPKEEKLWKDLSDNNHLGWKELRQYIINVFAKARAKIRP